MAKTYTANMLASVSFLSVNLAYLHTTDLLVSNENIQKHCCSKTVTLVDSSGTSCPSSVSTTPEHDGHNAVHAAR
ncbi:hypothetical protein ALC62_10669 [Cyphomyrmex costatus]|uniref:Uncharacterized protein n=1 Tax=Cyphomyrmex costatus TaxID=456900 RepID=A0A195CEQ0_9HYME|nr:hypothetical protein ALC62_10669 [Cyphomyrmex costatus]